MRTHEIAYKDAAAYLVPGKFLYRVVCRHCKSSGYVRIASPETNEYQVIYDKWLSGNSINRDCEAQEKLNLILDIQDG